MKYKESETLELRKRTFYRRPETTKTAPPKTPQVTPQVTPPVVLTGLESKILEKIAGNPRISRRQIAEALKIRPDTVKEYLEKLKKKHVLSRKGKTRRGYWEVLR